jgi:hypothetical protein
MRTALRGLVAFALSLSIAIGVGYLVFAWPILFKMEVMVVWGWIGFVLAPVLGFVALALALKFFSRCLNVATEFGFKPRGEDN